MSCYAISVLVTQAILCFTLHSQGIHSSVEFCDTLLPSKTQTYEVWWVSCLSKQTEEYLKLEPDRWTGFCFVLFFELPPMHQLHHSTLPYSKSFKLWSATPTSVLSTLFLPFYSCLCQLLPHVTKCIIHNCLKHVYINYRSFINSEPCANVVSN